MVILKEHNGYAHKIIIARLGPEDQGRTDDELLTCADRRGYHEFGPMHFGGTVEKRKGRQTNAIYARIKVNTD